MPTNGIRDWSDLSADDLLPEAAPYDSGIIQGAQFDPSLDSGNQLHVAGNASPVLSILFNPQG